MPRHYWGFVALTLSCDKPATPPATQDPPPQAAQTAVRAPSFVRAEAGDASARVRELAAAHPKSTLVVYVGASWCEPCRYFHRALERGELDEQLRGVVFIEFDADRDRSRLEAAGYGGRLIPRFARPAADGRFSGAKIEGGIKGEAAVSHIMARLIPLLAQDAQRAKPT